MAERWDAVVIGGGPSGSTCASLLAKRGFDVLLVDRAHFPRHKPCGEFMSPGVMNALSELGLDQALEDARPRLMPGMDIISPSGQRFRLAYHLNGSWKNASTLQRYKLDAALLSHARKSGVSIRQGFLAKRLIVRNGLVCGVAGIDGDVGQEIEARLTIVADGARSILARSLSMSAPPRWPVRLGLVAHYEGEPVLKDGFGQMHVSQTAGYCGIVALPDGQVNVAMVVPLQAVVASKQSARVFFEAWIASQPSVAETLAGCRRVSGVRGIGPIGVRGRRAHTPGALVVGDAAGFFDPFTGEGIYRALRGASLAAEVGSDVLLRGHEWHHLKVYDRLRAREFRSKYAVTALVQMFVQFPTLMDYALPRLARRKRPAETLACVLGDLTDPGAFLTPSMLWSALRP